MKDPALLEPAPADPDRAGPDEARSEPPRPRSGPPRTGGALESVQSLLYVLTISLFVVTFTLQPIRIPSESMEPALLVGDFLLMDKQVLGGRAGGLMPPAEVRRGEVIVFHEPMDDPSVHLVKRVIGVPGDRIHLSGGVVYRNGKALDESYTVYRRTGPDPYRDNFPDLQMMDARVNANWWIRLRALTRDGEIVVPPRSYFVMGDNRNDSEDSRYWGFVPRDAIVGTPLLIYFSAREAEAGDSGVQELPARTPPSGRFGFGRWDRMFRVVR